MSALRRRWMLCGALLALSSGPGWGQEGVLPGERRPELPDFEAPREPRPDLELPPVPPPPQGGSPRLSQGSRALVKSIAVEGSSVFTAEELEAATAPFSGRVVGFDDLLQAAEAVTALYVERGYLTSGAVIPDQRVEDGVVRLSVIEGRLAEIAVQGTRWFRERYFRDRLRAAGRAPVNVYRLERALQRFQGDPLVERIRARLEPTPTRGESRLTVQVTEGTPWVGELVASDVRPPSIGQTGLDVTAALGNAIGFADELRFRFGVTEGLRDYEGSYSIPVNRYDTLLTLHARYSRGNVILSEFDPLDIYSVVESYGIALEQPLLRDRGRELRVGVEGEYRSSRTFLAGSEFCTIPQAVECRPRLAVLRFPVEWSLSGQRSALAARSVISVGLDALGATRNAGNVPDGQFLAWLGQALWAFRFPDEWLRSEVLMRLDTQIADSPLLAIEKFSAGGMRTVRGYRENQLVRDNGVVGSIELRVPVYDDPSLRLHVDVAGFGDAGHAWDNNGPAKLPSGTLVSLGVGLRFSLRNWMAGYLYWGGRLLDAPRASEGPQRHGIHFLVSIDARGVVDDLRSL